MKKYIVQKIPMIVYKDLQKKQQSMKEMYKNLTGKEKHIPMTKVLAVVSKPPVYIDDSTLIKLFRTKKINGF